MSSKKTNNRQIGKQTDKSDADENKKVFLSKDELEHFKKKQNENTSLILALGQTELEISMLVVKKNKIISSLEQKATALNEWIKDFLIGKYGEGDVNPDTGEFIPDVKPGNSEAQSNADVQEEKI